MTTYILRRLLWIPFLLLGISLMTFFIFSLAPGDPVTALIKPGAMEATTQIGSGMDVLRERYGLDKPIHVRYLVWLRELLKGNLGYSYSTERPISKMIVEVLPATLLLQASSIGMALLFGIVLGVVSALKQYSVVDHALTFVALFGISVPSFFIALIAMFIFAVKLGWLPIAGMWTVGEPKVFP